jgi:tRNA modification GTPase
MPRVAIESVVYHEIAPNHAILLTAPGSAAIAVIRLLGPAVETFLRDHFSRPTVPGQCIHGMLSDGDRLIDDCVVVQISSQTADINVHGGPWVVQSVLELMKTAGFEIINPKSNLLSDTFVETETPIWRETLAHLSLARTELAARLLLAQPVAWEKFQSRADAGLIAIEELRQIEQDRALHWMLSPPKVAIVGAANVGKSTLANALFGQERSITADVPGTTRDWVGEIANINGLAVTLIDTAGLRATDDPIEIAAIAAGREEVGAADLVLLVLDRSSLLKQSERDLLLSHPNAVRIANKSDRPPAWVASEINAIEISASMGTGMKGLREAICRHFQCNNVALDRPHCFTERQIQYIARSLDLAQMK